MPKHKQLEVFHFIQLLISLTKYDSNFLFLLLNLTLSNRFTSQSPKSYCQISICIVEFFHFPKNETSPRCLIPFPISVPAPCGN